MNTETRADAQAAPASRRRGYKRAAWWLGGLALLLVALPVAVVWWAGSEGSLPRALQLAQRFLPVGQVLEFTDAQGSVTGGGRIRRLQWSAPGTELLIDDLQLSWSLRELLQRDLRVRTLSMRRLHLRTTPQPEPEQPFMMPDDLTLPFRVTLPIEIARIELERIDDTGTADVHVIEGLAARYRYDGEQHALRLSSLRYDKSQLQADARLHARTLALTAQIQASLRDLVPDVPMSMQATLTGTGTLAGGDAANIDLTLDVLEQAMPAEGARIEARALIHPWRTQPAQQVDIQLTRFNAHAFLPQAPVTSVQGRATVQPAGTDAGMWNAAVDFFNDQAGAWDRQRLPVRRVEAKAQLSLDDVRIDSARAELGGRTTSGSIALSGEIPLKPVPQPTLQLDLRQVDLRALMTTLPRTSFTGPVTLEPWQEAGRRVEADIRNALPGPLDRERAPLRQLLADLRLGPKQWHIETFDALLGTGRAQVRGDYVPQSARMDLRADLHELPLRDLHGKFGGDIGALLSGTASVSGSLNERLEFDASLSSEAAARTAASASSLWDIESFEASGSWSPTRLMLKRIHAIAFQSTVDGRDIDVSLPQMERVRGKLTAVAPGMQLRAETTSSRGTDGGKVVLQLDSAGQVVRWLRGLPFMAELVPTLEASGAASLDADWQGSWRQWLEGLKQPSRHPQLMVNATARTDGLRVELSAMADKPPIEIDVQKLTLDLHGNLRAATIAVEGDARARDTHALLELRLKTTQQGGRPGAPRWNIALEKFAGSVTLPHEEEPWKLQISENLQVVADTGADLALRASAGDATVLPPARLGADQPLKVTWQPLEWRRSARGGTMLQSTGSVTGLQPAWLNALRTSGGEGTLEASGMSTDLVLRGEWNVQMTDHVAISARLQRESGDLTLADTLEPVGIRTLDLAVKATDANVKADLNWDTERAGSVTASLGTRLTHEAEGWTLPPESPLEGSLRAKLEELNAWAFLVPPGWRIEGALGATATVAGTLAQPLLTGGIEADRLNVRSVLDGVDLHNGKLRATLRGSGMDISELSFEGGTGSRAYVRGLSGNRTPAPRERGRMIARGSIDWGSDSTAGATESGISLNLAAELERMQVLVRNDRQMTLSGTLSARLDEGQLQLRGDLNVVRATIQLPEAGAPTLGDDVKIVRSTDLRNPGAVEARQVRTELETRKPLDMEMKVNLGSDLALEGEGITTRLEGELTVRSAGVGSAPFTVFGEVRTVEGRYRAWGQELNVESGVVRFNGSYENPSLDLLAIRPNIEVRAGVRVTGTLMAPRVLLYSDPALPEGEKLSWVVLGRATVIAGGEGTSLQQAALGLAAGQLTGRLANGLGVDELGFSDSGVSIGKRISNELYLTYQQGLAGAGSTLFIFYDITRKLTIRGQASAASAVDLVYSFEFD